MAGGGTGRRTCTLQLMKLCAMSKARNEYGLLHNPGCVWQYAPQHTANRLILRWIHHDEEPVTGVRAHGQSPV
jgi:hypothetical protein